PPIYEQLRVFGCLCYAHLRPRDRDKFATRSRKCIFVGYPFGKKAWRLYDVETNEFIVSRDVVFFEDQFPGIEDLPSVTVPVSQTALPIDDWLINFETPVLSTTPEPSPTIPTTSSPTHNTTTTPDVSSPPLPSTPTAPSTSNSPPDTVVQP
uniref:Retroviral polymerase SH3-like domain-containing protein n=1 Tax=Brassica oleracea var. oleracea TaxID=109376 RepID=A0A0D2ZZS0_BRAOL